MTLLPRLADQVLNRPLMILPAKLALIASILQDRLAIDANELQRLASLVPSAPVASRFAGNYELVDPNDPRAGRKTYRQTEAGTAVISIVGSLVQRHSWVDALSGVLSYEKLKSDIAAAAADKTINAIVLDIDSPGGAAVGCFEAADMVRRAAGAKRVVAIANGLACSAAYEIAAAATCVVATKSSVVGSIGVVWLHAEQSRRLDKAGIATRLIYAGAHKVDGNTFEPLTNEVAAELQAEINRTYELFVASVAAHRPVLKPNAIRATEARTYLGADAVKMKMADEVGAFEDIVDELDSMSRLRYRTTRKLAS